MAKIIEVGDRVEVLKTIWTGYHGTVRMVPDNDGWGVKSIEVMMDYPPVVISIRADELRPVCPLQRLSEI